MRRRLTGKGCCTSIPIFANPLFFPTQCCWSAFYWQVEFVGTSLKGEDWSSVSRVHGKLFSCQLNHPNPTPLTRTKSGLKTPFLPSDTVVSASLLAWNAFEIWTHSSQVILPRDPGQLAVAVYDHQSTQFVWLQSTWSARAIQAPCTCHIHPQYTVVCYHRRILSLDSQLLRMCKEQSVRQTVRVPSTLLAWSTTWNKLP